MQIGHPDTEAVVSASTAAGGKGATAFIMLFSIFYCMGWNGLAWVICAENKSPTPRLVDDWANPLSALLYPTRIRGFCAMCEQLGCNPH